MEKMQRVLLQRPKDPENVMMWAACCTALYGFLRCSEFTIPSQATFDPVHLSLADVAVEDKLASTVVQITIKQSKIDPFRQGVQLYLGKTDTALCQVKAMWAYLATRDAIPGPLLTIRASRDMSLRRGLPEH